MVNSVRDLRAALAAEVRRLEPAPGIETRVLQQAMRQAEVRPHARSRVPHLGSLEAPRLMGLVAVLIALAIVVSMFMAIRGLHLPGPVPAGPGRVGQGTVITPVAFRCSLPVTVQVAPQVAVKVDFPGGMVASESSEPADNALLHTYDSEANRWVPVLRSMVSPDGMSWAYGTGANGAGGGSNGTVHVVDTLSGRDRQLWSGSGGAVVLGYTSNGLLFVETGPPGLLWVVDPLRPGSARKIGPLPAAAEWDASSVVSALGVFTFIHASDGRPNGVVRMDLNGQVTTWLSLPAGNTSAHFLGVDAGELPILIEDQARVLILTGPGTWIVVSDGSDPAFRPLSASSDPGHGIWFGESGSIWLYPPSGGLREVFAMPTSLFTMPPFKKPLPSGVTVGPPSPPGLVVDGPCT